MPLPRVVRHFVATVWHRKLVLVGLLVALAILSPLLWLWQAPATVSALLWRDYATIASWLLLALLLVLKWRFSERTARGGANQRSAFRMRPDGHRWLGLMLAVPLSWLLLSGSLTLYRAELDVWLTPQLRGCCNQTEPIPVSSADQLAAAQHFLLQQAGASDATSWYIELASVRKPYLTLHWPAVSEPGFALYRQYLTAYGEPLGDAMLVRAGQQSETFAGLVFDLHYTLLGRGWLEPLKRSLAGLLPKPVLAWLPTGLGICATLALVWCVFSLSGLGLSWQLLRQTPTQVLPRSGSLRQQGALRWHVWFGVLVSPWLLLYGVSAVVMQLGNWRDVPATLATGQYYAELFPQPPRRASVAVSGSVIGNGTALSVPQLQLLVAKWPKWPVGKVTWQQPTATSPAFWLLSPSGDAQWPLTPSGIVNPNSIAVQRIDDASLSSNEAATVSVPWQLRHHLYQLHQSAYLNPWGRALFCAVGMVAWLCVVFAVWRAQSRRLTWTLHTIVTLPISGLLVSAIASATQISSPVGGFCGGLMLMVLVTVLPRPRS